MPRPRLVREQVYLAETQRDWLQARADEIGISWQELLRGIIQAAIDQAARRGAPPSAPPGTPPDTN